MRAFSDYTCNSLNKSIKKVKDAVLNPMKNIVKYLSQSVCQKPLKRQRYRGLYDRMRSLQECAPVMKPLALRSALIYSLDQSKLMIMNKGIKGTFPRQEFYYQSSCLFKMRLRIFVFYSFFTQNK